MEVKRVVEELVTSGEAGRILDVTATRVYQLEEAGLLVSRRTMRGRRIYLRRDVEALKAKRETAGSKRSA